MRRRRFPFFRFEIETRTKLRYYDVYVTCFSLNKFFTIWNICVDYFQIASRNGTILFFVLNVSCLFEKYDNK